MGGGKTDDLGMSGGTHMVGSEVKYRHLSCIDCKQMSAFRAEMSGDLTYMDEGGWDDNECLLGPSSRLESSFSPTLLSCEPLKLDSSSIFNRLRTSAAES